MTTTTRPTATPHQTRGPHPADRAYRVFAAAVAVGLLHALDDAVLNRQPGVPVGQHLPALAVVTAACVVATVAFRRLRTGLRALLSLTIGAVTLTNGAMHVIHIVGNEVSGSDVSGVVAALAGAVLVILAAVLPFAHRGERNLPPGRRWAIRGLAMLTVPVLIYTVLMPIGVGIGQTHLFRVPIGEPPGNRYTDVVFESTDGLRLSGWYAPSRNGAAVVVVNTASGDRLGSVQHAQLLAEHGYGVLLYDARGTGDSEGSPNGYGWNWDRDVDGAIEFLQHQPDVDPARIGGLGLSTGGDVLIEVAAHNPDLKAVVTDGATIRSFADIPAGQRWASAHMLPVLATVMLLSGSQPGAPLVDLAAQAAPTRMLLIAAGSIPQEIRVNEAYAEAAGAAAELWALPDVRHTAAIRAETDAYERRVVGHFDRALR